MFAIMIVGLGGLVGSMFRFLLSTLISSSPENILKPALVVNVIGSFLIGTCLSYFEGKESGYLYLFLAPGLLGGFTTYSAFSADTIMMLKNHHYAPALFYISVTTLAAICAAGAGYMSRKIFL